MTRAEEAKLAAMEQSKLDAEAALAALEKQAEKKDAERAEMENTVRILNGRVDELANSLAESRTGESALETKLAEARADAHELTVELELVKSQRDEATERAASLAARLGTSAVVDTATADMFQPASMLGDSTNAVVAVMAATGLDRTTAAARIRSAVSAIEAEGAASDRAARESKGSTS